MTVEKKKVKGWEKQKPCWREEVTGGGRQRKTEWQQQNRARRDRKKGGSDREEKPADLGFICTHSFKVVMLLPPVPPSLYATCCEMQTHCSVSQPLTRDNLHWSRHWQHLLFFSVLTPPRPVRCLFLTNKSYSFCITWSISCTVRDPEKNPIIQDVSTCFKASCPTINTCIHTYGSILLIVYCCRNESYSTAPPQAPTPTTDKKLSGLFVKFTLSA